MNSTSFLRTNFLPVTVVALLVAWPSTPASGQSVFSVNVLGYLDVNFVAGSNLVANPLFARENTVSNLFCGVPDGTRFIPWHGSGSFGSANLYSSTNGWTIPDASFMAPDGGFLVLPTATTITFVGQPWEITPGQLCVDYPEGPSVRSWMPSTFCGFEPDDYQVLKWNTASQSYDLYDYFFGFWLPSTPQLGPAESALFTTAEAFDARSRFLGTIGDNLVAKGADPIELKNPEHDGTNHTFNFFTFTPFDYAVFCSTNLETISWRAVARGRSATNGDKTVIISNAPPKAFYRVLDDFTTNGFTVLLGGHRVGGQFAFQFYAPVTTNYTVQRTTSLQAGGWVNITNISATASNIVGAVDRTATGNSGYYRVRYGE